jgi:hypothetical protein
MMKNVRFYALLVLFSAAAAAEEAPAPAIIPPVSPALALPSEMMVKGEPVDPYCFMAFEDLVARLQPVDVTDCKKGKVFRSPPSPFPNDKRQYVVLAPTAVSYQFAYTDGSREGKPYSVKYQHIGEQNGSLIMRVQIEVDGKSSPSLTRILAVKREGDALKLVKEIARGDTNDSMIEMAVLKDGNLLYNQRISPYDFLTLANDNPHGLKPGKDLKNNNRMGIAVFEDGKLVNVGLSPYGVELAEASQSPYQMCFDKLYMKQIGEGEGTEGAFGSMFLNPDQLTGFTHAFNKQCVEEAATVAETPPPAPALTPAAGPAPASSDYTQLCRERMKESATQYGVEPEKYIAENQPYLQDCIRYYQQNTQPLKL